MLTILKWQLYGVPKSVFRHQMFMSTCLHLCLCLFILTNPPGNPWISEDLTYDSGNPWISGDLTNPPGNPWLSGDLANPSGNPRISGDLTNPPGNPWLSGDLTYDSGIHGFLKILGFCAFSSTN